MINNPQPFSPSSTACYVAGKKPDRSSTLRSSFIEWFDRCPDAVAWLQNGIKRADVAFSPHTPGMALHHAGERVQEGFFAFLAIKS